MRLATAAIRRLSLAKKNKKGRKIEKNFTKIIKTLRKIVKTLRKIIKTLKNRGAGAGGHIQNTRKARSHGRQS